MDDAKPDGLPDDRSTGWKSRCANSAQIAPVALTSKNTLDLGLEASIASDHKTPRSPSEADNDLVFFCHRPSRAERDRNPTRRLAEYDFACPTDLRAP